MHTYDDAAVFVSLDGICKMDNFEWVGDVELAVLNYFNLSG